MCAMNQAPASAAVAAGGIKLRGLLGRATAHQVLACLVLLAAPFILVWRVWWPDSQLRQVFAYGDFVEMHYAMRVYVASELRHGRLPAWDPYTYAGEPAVADSAFATFYPPGLWQIIFPGRLPFLALELEAVAHLGLAGVFTFLFVRRLTGRDGAGLVAGLTFSLGGFLTSYPMLQLIVLETAVWLPAGLWLTERALSRRSLAQAGLAGVLLGFGILAGHPQTVLYTAYAIGGYLVFRSWRLRLGWRLPLAMALLIGAVALSVGTPQWLPSLQISGMSQRAGWTYESVSQGFRPAELLGLLRPNPGQWSPLYVGLVSLALAAASLALWRRAETVFWAVVFALALLLSLGGHGFLYPLAYRLAPGFASFRHQERAAYLVSLALSVLAGYGYAALGERKWWPRWALPLVLALIFADLFHANQGVILQTPPPEGYYASTPSVEYLQRYVEQTGDRMARVSSEGLLPGDGNAGLVYHIRDVTGNGPLHLANYEQFIDTVPGTRWLQMLYVRHLLTDRVLESPLQAVVDEGDKRLYDLAPLGPRPAWITHDYRQAPDAAAAIALTADEALNPFETAVLEQAPGVLPQAPSGPEQVQVVGFDRRRAIVEATLSAPGILVLSEVDYPGWSVRVSGRPATGLRAYGVLRAVSLPAGHSLVDWRYDPWAVYLGGVLAGVGLLACGVLCWRERRATRHAVLP